MCLATGLSPASCLVARKQMGFSGNPSQRVYCYYLWGNFASIELTRADQAHTSITCSLACFPCSHVSACSLQQQLITESGTKFARSANKCCCDRTNACASELANGYIAPANTEIAQWSRLVPACLRGGRRAEVALSLVKFGPLAAPLDYRWPSSRKSIARRI